MSALAVGSPSLLDRLPPVRGRLTANAPLAAQTWFRVGGPAEVLFKPADLLDLAEFLQELPADVPRTVLGATSNVLIRDGGIPGVVIRLTSFSNISVSSSRGLTTGPSNVPLGLANKSRDDGHDYIIITAETGALDATVAQVAQENNLTGLEFLSGIPGSIGGAVVMNAGCYGRELNDVFIDADIMLPTGEIEIWGKSRLGLSYRHSSLPDGAIVLSARLAAHKGDPHEISAKMDMIKAERDAAQPTRARTGGSTFANPPGDKAWRLIDAAGCRGLTVGGAQVSEKHCNFLLNTGIATATDLENLGEEVRRRVFATSGVDLQWEIKRIGVPA